MTMTAETASTTPNAKTFRIERSAHIQAAPAKIFALINDFNDWRAWSPYEGIDPAMKRTYSGPASGRGAVYAWEGNNKVGSGRMEILSVVPDAKIVIQLDFLKPFEAHNTAEFTLEPDGEASRVTWAMIGSNASKPFIMKVMSLFFNMDKMVGGQFEAGLAKLKAVAEANGR